METGRPSLKKNGEGESKQKYKKKKSDQMDISKKDLYMDRDSQLNINDYTKSTEPQQYSDDDLFSLRKK